MVVHILSPPFPAYQSFKAHSIHDHVFGRQYKHTNGKPQLKKSIFCGIWHYHHCIRTEYMIIVLYMTWEKFQRSWKQLDLLLGQFYSKGSQIN